MSRFDLTPEQAVLGATTTTTTTPTETDPAVVYTIPEAEPDCDPLPIYDPEARLREWEDERQRRKLQRENDRQAKRALLAVSPAGRHGKRAEEAWKHGDAYYQVVLSLGGMEPKWGDHVSSKDLQADPVGPLLTVIEEIGWRLDQVGYVSNPAGEILGAFLFRRPEARSAAGPSQAGRS